MKRALHILTTAFVVMLTAITTSAQVACPGFRTYTQGAYGSTQTTSQPVQYLINNFASAFPNGLVIGCAASPTTGRITLTSASAVRAFLPNGSTGAQFAPGLNAVNPTKSNFSNVLAGQLVALRLNMRFDQVNPNFAPSTTNLKDLIISSGPFVGWTVQQLFDAANNFIGRCGTNAFTASQYVDAVDRVNRGYDNGIASSNYLVCPLSATCSTTRVTCFGGNNGTMTVIANGGLPPYTYTLSPSGAVINSASTSATFNNLTSGQYTCTVRDASNRTITTTCTVATNTNITFTTGKTDNVCNAANGPASGSVSISNIQGGVSPYVVTWTGAGIPGGTATGTSINNLPAGTYSYTVVDNAGCTKSGSLTVTEPAQLSVTPQVTSQIACFNDCNGAITANASGGTGNISYTWTKASDGSTLQGSTQTNLCADTYSVSVRDANNCTANASTSLTLNNPAEISFLTTKTDNTCNAANANADGTAEVTNLTGGTGALVVTWQDGFVGASRSELPAGTYNFTVTDENLCSKSGSVVIEEPAPFSVEIKVRQRITCANSSTGSLTVTTTNGVAEFSYVWNDGTTTASRTYVEAGSYSVTVTDATGCVATDGPVELDNPTKLEFSAVPSLVNPECGVSPCNGSASVSVQGGETPYTYEWSVANESGSEVTGLCEGEALTVNITDARGCILSYNFGSITCRQSGCDPLRTYTQGGWGSEPRGNNPGTFLRDNFATAFPDGVTIGCEDNILTFVNSNEIMEYLPEGGTPDTLPDNSVLQGQLLAAMLNVGFDSALENFASSTTTLASMIINEGPFAGMTVGNFLDLANDVAGGCVLDYDLSEVNEALTNINENYDNGNQDLGFLTCPGSASGSDRRFTVVEEPVAASNALVELFPNPTMDITNLRITVNQDEMVYITVYSITGQMLVNEAHRLTTGTNNIQLELARFAAGTRLVKIQSSSMNVSKMVVVE